MLINRRGWLSITLGRQLGAAPSEHAGINERRISRVIHEYEQQGLHRSGTTVDRLSADWLCGEVRRAGLVPTREPFPLSRVDPVTSALIAGNRRIEGIPLFDGAFTGADGVRGRLGPLGSDAEIGLAETITNAAASGPLGDARRKNFHKAIVCVTRGGRPGLCPSNANSFLQPFGPPVLQVSSEEASWLAGQAQRGVEVQLIAQVARTPARAVNVTATIRAPNSALAPLVMMTPRSGWYACASERGGGLACWLEVMRALRTVRLGRDVLFVASTGHELGHLGIKSFVDRRPGIVPKSAGWMHLGASIGAATDPGNTLQASDDEFDAMLSRALSTSGLSVDQRTPRGTVPGGEAAVVHRGGGRYVSIIGHNGLFHNPGDLGPEAVDPGAIAKFSTAFIAIAGLLAAS